MSQVTIYLDEKTMATVRAAVESTGVSQSQWIADAIRARIQSEWPASVRTLAGAWPDLPEAEELRRLQPRDQIREQL